MPIIAHSSYVPPCSLVNGHLQTLLPSLFRKVRGVAYQRERITTSDADFLDLDWVATGGHRLAVIAHGLEGDSNRAYAQGMVRALSRNGWDAVVWNARGCSGEPNRVLRFTHSGATEDLQTVISHVTDTRLRGRSRRTDGTRPAHSGAAKARDYDEVALIGFSLGGNLTLKYLGERGRELDPRIKKAVAFSVPCDLQSSSLRLAGLTNRIYMRRFLISLRQKIRAKMKVLPGKLDDRDYGQLRTFKDFDDRYTAPIHGFADAEDYWRQCSCRPALERISIPTLLINARNDPFLAEACFPIPEAEANPNFYLEMPASGGHVGFITFNHQGEYWSESRAISFLK